jgi:hypothetical protein
MKTTTRSPLGGACDLPHVGADAHDIITSQDRHLREAAAGGSSEREPDLRDTKSRWRRPVSGPRWCRQVQRAIAALPNDVGRR